MSRIYSELLRRNNAIDRAAACRKKRRVTTNPPSSTGKRDPMALMRAEMRVNYGPVGDMIGDTKVEAGTWHMKGDELLLRASGLAMRYRKGHGVTIERDPVVRSSEEQLYLNGTVYAAAACINGFYPLHASAVAWNGGVHAFTGPAGAGKSTLVAALGSAGLPMFCDDTLILDLSDPAVPLALPGHKRLKLTDEALALTGAEAQEQVDDEIEKFYALPAGGDWQAPLPLRQLIFLEGGDRTETLPISGAEKIARLSDDHYTAELFLWANDMNIAHRFAAQSRLARQIAMVRLVRPWDTGQFTASVTLARELIFAQAIQP